MHAERSLLTVDELVAGFEGGMLALPKDESGVPMAAVRALIRRRPRPFHLLCVPACGLHADLLIGAGLVHTVECGGVVVGELGAGARSRRGSRRRPAVEGFHLPRHPCGPAGGGEGAPFASLRGIIGSDLLRVRPEWRVIDNPFADGGDPVLLVPALNPDCFLFHARWGDRHGNVWTGGRRDLAYTAHASRKTFVTVEHIWDGNLLTDPVMSAGTLSEVYVSGLAHVPGGTWPMTLQHEREEDTPHIVRYMDAARTDEGFQAYLDEFVANEPRIDGVRA